MYGELVILYKYILKDIGIKIVGVKTIYYLIKIGGNELKCSNFKSNTFWIRRKYRFVCIDLKLFLNM